MQITATSKTSKLGFVRFLTGYLPHKLQERMKRTIFVFSVLAVLDKSSTPCESTIRDINVRLKLAKTEGICKASAKAHSNIWEHTNIGDSLYNGADALSVATTRLERELLADYYVRHCPEWLRYGIPDGIDMTRDLHRLFNALATKNL